MSDVLVLNRQFYAIHITSWRRALTLVYLEHASIVDEDYKTYNFDDWCDLSQAMEDNPSGFVHTPKFKIAVPSAIALKLYDHLPPGDVKFTRRNIYEHYGYKCCYCGKKFATNELNLDHVVPRSRGGESTWSNIVTSCIVCNLKKGDRLPKEAGMKLLIKPAKPKWNGRISLVMRTPFKVRSSWQHFIDNVYWNTELEQ